MPYKLNIECEFSITSKSQDTQIFTVDGVNYAVTIIITKQPITIEEKIALATFYVEDGKQYTIGLRMIDERYFIAVDDIGNEYKIDYDSIPANAYFLGTHKL